MIWFGEEFFFVQTSGDITFFSDIQDGVSLFRSIISLITIIFFSVGNSPPPQVFHCKDLLPSKSVCKIFFSEICHTLPTQKSIGRGVGVVVGWGGGGGRGMEPSLN